MFLDLLLDLLDGYRVDSAMVTMLTGNRGFEPSLLEAEYIYEIDGKWQAAIELYKCLLGNFEPHEASSPQWKRIGMDSAGVFFELGEHDKAIDTRTAALEMNRHSPQAHKYVALAQKASGDIEGAKASVNNFGKKSLETTDK
mmetsp:Transcript_60818/g.148959  ORF Transcript_60818/g.148959 Transcript_60818/m.148959 type:complete len:142 (-) Transcript_60818:9-434(-)